MTGSDMCELASRVRKDFMTNSLGVITDPGRYEGEMIYIPFFDHVLLEDGGGDGWDDGGNECRIPICRSDRDLFPELPADATYVVLRFRDDGFVCGSTK